MAKRTVMIASVAAGALFIALVFAHVGWMNGPRYWSWPWVRRGDLQVLIPLMLLAGLPALAAHFLPRRLALVAALLVAAAPAILQIAGLSLSPFHPGGMQRADALIRHHRATSYYTVAQALEPHYGWMAIYDQVIAQAPTHAATKPPGPVVFFLMTLRWFGDARAPVAATILISILTGAAVLAMYLATRAIAGHDAALQAATLLALMPSITVFYPALDTVYPLLTVLLFATWVLALERGRLRYAVLFGIVLFVVLMTTYVLLVLGAGLGIITGIWLWRTRNLALVAKQVGVVAATVLLLFLVLWLATQFDPIATFRAAVARQDQIRKRLPAHPGTIQWDLSDFLFGLGWVPLVPAIAWLVRRDEKPEVRAIGVAGLATPLIVALTGVLQAETARVWIFLMPLIAFAAALELARWERRERLIVHATLLLCTVAVFSNAIFIWI